MYQKVKTNPGTYDLVVPSDYMIEKMIEEDLLEKIDFNNIPNYKYIGNYKNLSYDPSNEYSVPYMWGTIGIIYDSTRVTEPVTSGIYYGILNIKMKYICLILLEIL